jgi:hypothetical protein
MRQLIGYSEEVLVIIDEPETPQFDDCPLCYGECICFADPS